MAQRKNNNNIVAIKSENNSYTIAVVAKISCSILLAFVSIGGVPHSTNIEWSSTVPLQWSDYQARVPHGAKYGAVTAIEVHSTNTFPDWHRVVYNVTCVMIRDRSWFKPEFMSDTALLNHERRHFDLAECSARSLRSILQREQVSIEECNQRLQILRDSVYHVWVSVDMRYDLETSHGTIAKEQERWTKKIAQTLDSLSPYSEPRFVVELKP